VVDFHSRLGTDDRIANDPIAFLIKDILWSASNSSLKMLSGFRGSGKTTELLRLRKLLREERYVVLYINIEDYVEVKQPLDPTSFLISLVGSIDVELRENPEFRAIRRAPERRYTGPV
jgi:predicted AAA+ superfamily ATPase